MIEKFRRLFNQHFSEESYAEFLNSIDRDFDHRPTFRIAETPFFSEREKPESGLFSHFQN